MNQGQKDCRYEFRVFGAELGDLYRMLRGAFHLAREETRKDVYLIGDDWKVIFKLRDANTLDLKRFVERKRAFQLWAPVGLVDLPARGQHIADTFDDGVTMPSFEADRIYNPSAVIAAFAGYGRRVVQVAKWRRQYETDCGLAEFANLIAGGSSTFDTVAIEGTDADALENFRARLGLKGHANVSYPEFLMEWNHSG